MDGNNLPSIPQSFIKKYIEMYNKGQQIKEVMVEYDEIPDL
jgi:septation ring formation regulator EzrA